MATTLSPYSTFRPLHIPPLLAASAMGIGALMPLWNPRAAIRAFGFPERIAISEPAQACFTVYGARSTCLGAAIWIFYLQGKMQAVDTILALQIYTTAVDAYICWREGVPQKAVMRVFAGVLVGGWGISGLTSRFS
ncbi:hypothetical protein LTR84_009429 [Exophiala bonariae]|uniref:Uncharacterized protein n=1 Tax=Exophiala bonariae TaxID=1690606 RepID=A0AAV9MV27_9EURO|nr:hypothetical protein LTR84_009429 [Exophiala bonariae]